MLTAEQRRIIRDTVGMGNIMAISGLRVTATEMGIDLPVASGYRVSITLDPSDTYTVKRVFRRSGVDKVKGEISGIYADQLSELAYRAGMFRSYSETEWMN